MAIAVGSRAVDFELPSTSGLVRLSQFQRRPLLLSFFSMAFTPV